MRKGELCAHESIFIICVGFPAFADFLGFVSSKGIYSVFGASQFILDSFCDNNYSIIPDSCINPLILSDYCIFNIRSGEWEYNSKNNCEWGLLNTSNTTFSTTEGGCHIAIRLVQDEGTIFNKNSEMPFMFYQKIGICNEDVKIFNNARKKIDVIEKASEVLILYKSLDGKKYFVFYKKNNSWECSWIDSEYIKIIKKSWYEIERE